MTMRVWRKRVVWAEKDSWPHGLDCFPLEVALDWIPSPLRDHDYPNWWNDL